MLLRKRLCNKIWSFNDILLYMQFILLSKIIKTESFCKKYGWDKTCRTCQQIGEYHFIDKAEYFSKDDIKEET